MNNSKAKIELVLISKDPYLYGILINTEKELSDDEKQAVLVNLFGKV